MLPTFKTSWSWRKQTKADHTYSPPTCQCLAQLPGTLSLYKDPLPHCGGSFTFRTGAGHLCRRDDLLQMIKHIRTVRVSRCFQLILVILSYSWMHSGTSRFQRVLMPLAQRPLRANAGPWLPSAGQEWKPQWPGKWKAPVASALSCHCSCFKWKLTKTHNNSVMECTENKAVLLCSSLNQDLCCQPSAFLKGFWPVNITECHSLLTLPPLNVCDVCEIQTYVL